MFELKVYATWSTYNIVTDMGTKKEVLRYVPPNSEERYRGWWKSTPYEIFERAGSIVIVDGRSVYDMSMYERGARPASYELKNDKECYELNIEYNNYDKAKTLVYYF